MTINVYGKNYIVTDMIVFDRASSDYYKYNVFDDKYRHVATIDAKDFDDFKKIFESMVSTNKIKKYE